MLHHFDVEPLDPNPAFEATWLESAASAMEALSARSPASGPATIAVPGHLALTKFVKTPAIEQSKRGKIIQFEATQNIPYPLDEVVWDHVVVSDDGMDLEVMLMAVKTEAVDGLCNAAAASGLPPVHALPAALALRQAYLLNYPERTDSALLVDVGARSTHLVFVEPGRFFLRTLPLAGNSVTAAIAEAAGLEFPAAETLKREVLGGRSELPEASPARTAVVQAAENFTTRLHLEIARSMANLRRQSAAAAPVAVMLTGGGASFGRVAAGLGEKLKLPVETFDPLRRVELMAGAAAARAPEHATRLAVAVGAAAGIALQEAAITATLLPPALGAAIADRRRRPALVGAAALAMLALLPPIWHYHRRALAAQAEIAAIDEQLRPLRSLQSRNAANLDEIERVKKQVEALHGLTETKSNWIDFFTDLQGRLVAVEDVWLEKLAVLRAPPVDHAAPDAKAPALRLTLSGRLLDKNNPVSKVSEQSTVRVRRLLEKFKESRFIADVEDERFDNSQPGILRFDFTLVVKPENPL